MAVIIAMEAVMVARSYALAALLLFPTWASAKTSEIKPSVEYERTFSDNVFLTTEDTIDEDIDIIRFKLNWFKEENFWSSRLDSIYEEIFYHSVKSDSDDYFTYNFDTSLHNRQQDIRVGIRANRSQSFSSFFRTNALDNVNLSDNRAEVDSHTLYFNFDRAVSRGSKLNFRASTGRVNFVDGPQTLSFGDRFENNTVDSYSLRLSDNQTFRERWYINLNHDENRYKDPSVADTKRSAVDAGFRIPLNSHWNISLRYGNIDNSVPQAMSQGNGDYYAAGIAYWSASKLRFELLAGEQFSEASLQYFVSSRTNLSARYVEQKLGFLPEKRTEISWKTTSRKSTLELSRKTSIQTFANEFVFRINEDGTLGSGLPPALGTDPVIDPNTNTIIASEFILKQNNIAYSRRTRKLFWQLKISEGERTPIGREEVVQDFQAGLLSLDYRLNRYSTVLLESMIQQSEYVVNGLVSDLRQNIIRFQRKFSYKLTGQFYISNINQEVADRQIDFQENRIGLILSSNF